MVGAEHQSVVQADSSDGLDHVEYRIDLIGHVLALKVHVTGRAPSVVRGQQHTALENQPVCVRRDHEAGEESLQRVDLVQLIGGPALLAGQILQVEVRTASDGGAGGTITYSMISKASRSAFSACGNLRAITKSSADDDPRRRNQRFKAAYPNSEPSW